MKVIRGEGRGVRGEGRGARCRFYLISLIPFLLLFPSSLTSHPSSLVPSPSHAADIWPQIETRHFLVIAEPTPSPDPVSLSDWDVMLRQYIEQLDAKYATLFGGTTLAQVQPTLGQKPILFICADKVSYLKRLGEYGVANPATATGSGGYYHPEANIIFTWRQPTDYYARHVVLHEVAHWYCLQLLGERYTKLPLWLCEGLADHAAFHTWDGKTLCAMRLPHVLLENYPFRLRASGFGLREDTSSPMSDRITPDSVLRCFERLRAELNTDVADVTYNEYALAWGLVVFLLDEFPGEMTRFFTLLKHNDMNGNRERNEVERPDTPAYDPVTALRSIPGFQLAECWQSAFEDDENQPTWSQLVDWANGHQLPWHWVWNHWEDMGEQLLGISDSTALIVQNPAYKPHHTTGTDPESNAVLFHCEVAPLLEQTIIGLVFHYESNERFEMLQFRNVGSNATEWRHVRFAQNQWEMLSPWNRISGENIKHHPQRTTLEIHTIPSLEGNKLRFLYNDHTVTERPCSDDGDDFIVTPPFGLVVQSGAAQFRCENKN